MVISAWFQIVFEVSQQHLIIFNIILIYFRASQNKISLLSSSSYYFWRNVKSKSINHVNVSHKYCVSTCYYFTNMRQNGIVKLWWLKVNYGLQIENKTENRCSTSNVYDCCHLPPQHIRPIRSTRHRSGLVYVFFSLPGLVNVSVLSPLMSLVRSLD